jgi:hypothetical protein
MMRCLILHLMLGLPPQAPTALPPQAPPEVPRVAPKSLPKTVKVKVEVFAPRGHHWHECPKCKYLWSHAPGGSHWCPHCGKGYQTDIYRGRAWIEEERPLPPPPQAPAQKQSTLSPVQIWAPTKNCVI